MDDCECCTCDCCKAFTTDCHVDENGDRVFCESCCVLLEMDSEGRINETRLQAKLKETK